MKIKKSTLQNILIVLVLIALLISTLGLMLNKRNENSKSSDSNTVTSSGDKQIINLVAKAGYSPKIIEAKANIDSILRIATNNTFDCSSALRIPDLKVTKNLPANGNTDIVIPAQEIGSVINGTCSMGMYSFEIKFV